MARRNALLVLVLTAAQVPAADPPKPVVELALDPSKPWDGRGVDWLGFSPDGKTLAARYPTKTDDLIQLWDTATWREARRLTAPRRPRDRLYKVPSCAFARDGKRLLVADPDVRIYDLAGGDLAKPAVVDDPRGGGMPLTVWVTGKGNAAFVVTVDRNHAGLLTFRLPAADNVRTLMTGQFEDESSSLSTSAMDVGGTRLAVGVGGGGRPAAVEVWDVAAVKRTARLTGHEAEVWSLAFSPDGRTLASGGGDTTVRLWDVAAGKGTAVFTGPKFTPARMTFTPDGKALVFASYDKNGDPNLWVADVSGKKVVAAVSVGRHGVTGLAVSPDGAQVATCTVDDVVRVWDLAELLKQGK